jgi:tRNA pseudouridine38-40 synthase
VCPEAAPAGVATFRLGIEFDGSGFHGWQVQPGARTVQGEIERAIRSVTGQRVRIAGAGRTDAGCHAVGQVASVVLATRLPEDRLRAALNAHLPPDVRIVEAVRTRDGFHARFAATRRAYRYLIVPRATALRRAHAWARPIRASLPGLNEASGPLLGRHDFTPLSRRGGEAVDPHCSVSRARWSGTGRLTRFDIEADRFLYSMVRRIVSTVSRAAVEGGGSRAVRAVLEARDRRAAAPPAPAHGLYLMRVRYPRLGWLPRERMNVFA